MAMARWAHLFPSRTQKLSTAVAKVVGLWPGENSAPPGFFFYGGIFDLSAAFWPPFLLPGPPYQFLGDSEPFCGAFASSVVNCSSLDRFASVAASIEAVFLFGRSKILPLDAVWHALYLFDHAGTVYL